jgi:SAM-dependent methyltransferase
MHVVVFGLKKIEMKNIINTLFNKLGFHLVKIEDENFLQDGFGVSNLSNRESWLKSKLLTIPSGSRILDAGAGELQYKKFCEHLDYVSQDFGKYDGLGNNIGLQTQSWDNSKLDIISDIVNIPQPDYSFDAIMCVEVFEHLPTPIDAIKEFSRLIRKDGSLLITAPFCSLTHFAPYHYYSGFNRYFYEKHLVENGFDIEEITPNGSYFEYLAQELQFRLPNIYSDVSLNNTQKSAIKEILILLNNMHNSDKGSSELLCFGYHVIGRKK